MAKKNTIGFIIIFFFTIVLSSFTDKNKDSLIYITQHGTDKEKVSAYYYLGNLYPINSKSLQYLDTSYYYYKLNPNDTDLMNISKFRIYGYTKSKQYNLAISNGRKAIRIGERINETKNIVEIYIYISKIYSLIQNFDSSFYFINKAIDANNRGFKEGLIPEKTYYNDIAYCKFVLGKQYFRQGDYEKTLDYLYDGLRDYERVNNYDGQAKVHLNIGNVYSFNNEYDNAYIEYKKVLLFANMAGQSNKYNKINTNIGVLFFRKEEYDSALFYFNRSLLLINKNFVNNNSLAGIYSNMGLIFKKQKLYDSSLVYFFKALDIQQKINSERMAVNTKANIGITYIEMGKYANAKKMLLESLKYTKANKMLESTKEIYNGLATIAKETKDYKSAYEYNLLFVQYRDSLSSVEVAKKISEYREQYEAEKKDRQIESLHKESQMQQLIQEKQAIENNRQKYINISLIILAILLFIIILAIQRYFSLRNKANKELMDRKEQLSQQKILDLVKTSEIGSIGSFMEGQEKERSRIATELHDRLGSLLSTVKLHFSSIEAANNDTLEDKEGFSFALDLLDNSVEEVRTISHNLSKGILTQFGLIGAVENLRDAVNAASQIQIKLIRIGPKTNLTPEIEIELFRIIQELVTNAIKHSRSEDIFVQLMSDKDGLSISVEDHGIGFNMKKQKNKGGIGLKNLRERVERIGGVYDFESAVGRGTSVMIEIKNSY